MAIQKIWFGQGETDALVMRYFQRVGIEPNYVTAYSITRDSQGGSTITVEMLFDDEPAEVGEKVGE